MKQHTIKPNPHPQWEWDHTYPVRCRIVDATGHDLGNGWVAQTPPESVPHIGKEGIAELSSGGRNVRITLDDGTVIFGSSCWWEAIPPKD